jgi:hypothetical protein
MRAEKSPKRSRTTAGKSGISSNLSFNFAGAMEDAAASCPETLAGHGADGMVDAVGGETTSGGPWPRLRRLPKKG